MEINSDQCEQTNRSCQPLTNSNKKLLVIPLCKYPMRADYCTKMLQSPPFISPWQQLTECSIFNEKERKPVKSYIHVCMGETDIKTKSVIPAAEMWTRGVLLTIEHPGLSDRACRTPQHSQIKCLVSINSLCHREFRGTV